MGWRVSKNWVAVPIGTCGESDCEWSTGFGLTEFEVDRQVQAHWHEHADAYQREQEALDDA